jgi:hypothetical protein
LDKKYTPIWIDISSKDKESMDYTPDKKKARTHKE